MTAYGATSFVDALNRTNLTDAVNGARGITALVPDNAAFARAGLAPRDTDSLATTLKNHIIGSTYYSTDFVDGSTIYAEN